MYSWPESPIIGNMCHSWSGSPLFEKKKNKKIHNPWSGSHWKLLKNTQISSHEKYVLEKYDSWKEVP